MKAYKDAEGHVRLFRPYMNMERLNKSSSRLGLPVSSYFFILLLMWAYLLIFN